MVSLPRDTIFLCSWYLWQLRSAARGYDEILASDDGTYTFTIGALR